MGLKTTCDSCGRVVVGLTSGLQNVNGRYLCKTCFSNPCSATKYYCNSCGNYSSSAMKKGSGWIEFILYLCYLVPGIIYSIWRRSGSPNVCPICRSSGLVPAQVAKPHAEKDDNFINGNSSTTASTKKCPVCAETIKLEAIKCRFCGELFDSRDVARQVSSANTEDDFEDRVLCSDGNCIGVIGSNGLCKVCGKEGR